MDNALVVGVFQRHTNLRHDIGCRVHGPGLVELGCQRVALFQGTGDDIGQPCLLSGLANRGDVGVIEVPDGARQIVKAFGNLRVRPEQAG